MTLFWKRWVRRLGYSIAGIIILFATIVSVCHLLTPVLNEHKSAFEKWASQLLNLPVTVGHVKISWHIVEPEITFEKVAILNKDSQKPTLEINNIKVDINIFRSLFAWAILTENIQIAGAQLTLHHKSGEFHIEGLNDLALTDDFTGADMQPNEMMGWIFSLPSLMLKDIDIHYVPKQGVSQEIVLEQLWLKNNYLNHQLQGQVTLKQEIPTTANVDLNWQGDLSHPETISANLYLYLEGVSFPQWLQKYSWHSLQIQEGLGSFKIWADWNKGQLNKAQTTFAIYDLQWQSLMTHKSQNLPRISGNLGWKRDGETQVIAGDNILIDFATHLWPTTDFSVTYTPTTVQSIKIGYIDLTDIKRFVLTNKLLPEAFEKKIIMLNPQGELNTFRISLTNEKEISTFSTIFKNISINEWEKIPGFKNLSGLIAWDGKQGKLTFNSFNTTLMSSLFDSYIKLDQIRGDVECRKENSLVFTSRNLQIQNTDLAVQARFSVNVPETDSPVIDLNANLNIVNAARITRYIPMKPLKDDLQKWLKNAFRSGSFPTGNIVLQGKLKDFPFDNHEGKFEATVFAKDLELNFAPDWMPIKNLNGTLNFENRLMRVVVHSGILSGVPLKQIHIVMNDIGKPAPEVLQIEGNIQADFSEALQFIQTSPLKNTIGKSLADIQLKGPMELALALAIPVAKPETLRVLGNVNTPAATLNLPEWKLGLTQLQGHFQFNENELRGGQFQAQLFNAPVTIQLMTQHDYESGLPAYIKAVITGNINLTTLQNWLGVSVSNVAEGATNYTAELHLPAQTKQSAIEIILNSNLQGVSLNLPENYGKKAAEAKALTVALTAVPNQPLKVKVDYDKLISAALQYQKKANNFTLVNGEVRLGEGANWQTKPGLLFSGNIPVLDWEKVKAYLPANSNPADSLTQRIDLRIGTLNWLGQQFKQIRVQMEKLKNAWQMNLTSETILGQLIIPFDMKQQGLQAKFEHLFLQTPAVTQAPSTPIDPKTLPALSLQGDDVRIDGKPLGEVVLNIMPSKTGVTIKQFSMSSSLMDLDAEGDWQLNKTRLSGNVSTSKLSELLTAWNFDSKAVVVHKGEAKFDLNWAGAPFQLSQKTLAGSLSLNIGKGRIVDVGDSGAKVGLARMLNLFSLQTIPRRLSLDFSDLFKSGYSFDYMKGDFSFKNGSAFTENSRLDGPIAKIEFTGRIGLVAKDFDVVLGVTPYVTGSLPVVATIATAFNPLVGIATFAMDRAIPVSKLLTHRYKITGPWDQPEWAELGTGK